MHKSDAAEDTPSHPRIKAVTSAQIVTADSVQAEEVPTIPLGSMQTISELQPEVAVHSITPTQAVRLPAPLIVQPAEYHRGLAEWLRIWWNGMRPSYLPLSLMPVLLGSVLAWTQSITTKTPRGDFHPQRFLALLLTVLCLQIGAHLVNDYYDYLRGVDTSNALGPGGLIQQGLIKPVRVLTLGLLMLLFGTVCGVFTALAGSPLLLVFVLIGLLCAYFYSATAFSISSLTLGEVVAFLIFGPLLTLAAYTVQTAHFDRVVLVYGLSLGLLATAFIHLNNMRDAESDAQAGKRTLASYFDLRMSRFLYLLFLLGAYVPIIMLAVPRHAPHLLLITLWTLPGLAVLISGVLRTDSPPSLHLHMRKTLALETLFTILLMVALVILAYWPLLALPLPAL
ncbi:MAG TPA: 1,4-dihydroxy-2-naphthoate octaprenyltransferase [Ktedonobacteraceae bacterium]|nr:1,4-dihydroxy-2-naphthoate octaprenyltransferase [Ktedonobacteraceae bacterium]